MTFASDSFTEERERQSRYNVALIEGTHDSLKCFAAAAVIKETVNCFGCTLPSVFESFTVANFHLVFYFPTDAAHIFFRN